MRRWDGGIHGIKYSRLIKAATDSEFSFKTCYIGVNEEFDHACKFS